MSNLKSNVHIWLRDETKPFERRTALTPAHARKLVKSGFHISVESSEVRCFEDQDYVRAGCSMAASGAWRNAPTDAYILGLKELPEEDTPLSHRHIFFAHAYKGQKGWDNTISRFKRGYGLLLDLEFLVDEHGRRVAAFGRWAGYAGAALGLDIWAHQQLNGMELFPPVALVNNKDELLQRLRGRIQSALQKARRSPRAIIIGAKGRCGAGAAALFHDVDLGPNQVTLWDKEETSAGEGPFGEILEHDLFVNCVLVQGQVKPFVTRDLLATAARRLSVISDVSCDPSSPYNPIPVYDHTTTFTKPAIRLSDRPLLDLTAIDHLPTLLPRESSEDFGEQLLPHLMALGEPSAVWVRASKLYESFEKQV